MYVVTGMHRSGTSAISALLAKLGMDFGPIEDHLPADRWNARGYFEHKQVFAINSRIVTGAGRSIESWYVPVERRTWHQRAAMVAVKARYLFMPQPATLARRAARLSKTMKIVGREVRELAVKDPRFCLLLEAWRQHIPIERVLFCYRAPGSVVRSLRAREGIPSWLGFRFWTYHVEAFLDQAERFPGPIFAVDYDALFTKSSSSREAVELFAFAEVDFDPGRWDEVAGDALDRRLRHHTAESDDLPPRVFELDYRIRILLAERHRGRH